ncbi:MAG: hemerythrin domain-containing protein [Rhodospirillales bacterium]|nr:hemerythrin domain-containing protein [Rhodospirillales bacterium]MCW8861565.1 hemerythrin domain-containing protein [Rhodospirillales bacterium]MCW8951390.1 hemerythrin domain-containing protein [Rhodospirillales bacterium]MCW8971120.1 hemerythrin domain-containing protein [Rhodospirillales bacterium]MCW9003336.1 hemerythrin domain-containing protein [Rhodospirillales bacterium]
MYDHRLNITRALHNDHLTTLALLEKLETTLRRIGPGNPPEKDDVMVSAILNDIRTVMEAEVTGHFAFEEEHLFPRFAEHVDHGIPMMLQGEHETIRPIAARLRELAIAALENGFDAASWAEFSDVGMELVEREVFHIQKEEMGFLPALDQIIDPEDDGELTMAYAEIGAK